MEFDQTLQTYSYTVKPRYIATIGKREFWRYNSLAMYQGQDFCQFHVDIVRCAWDIGKKNNNYTATPADVTSNFLQIVH